MLRSVKNIFWMLALVVGAQSAFGFALEGPIPPTGTPDIFETPDIAYGLGGDLSTPKDLKEGFRRNTPVMYYSFDLSFYDYFGAQGIAEIDKAMAMFNAVGDVSQYSSDLNEWPTDSRGANYRAVANDLTDVKSWVMWMMTEQLGFTEPTRWVWAIHSRIHLTPGPACPANMEYLVFQRNFSIMPTGPDTYPTTSYVNGVLYSYFIDEVCAPPNPVADAVEFPVDPLSQPYSAVADGFSEWYAGLSPGQYYTSLTREDVGAMRYLFETNNLNPEASGARVTEFVTNDAPQIVTTQDLNALATAAKVNNAAALQALFPGLTILSTSNYFGLQVTTNVTEILRNSPLDPAGAPPSHPFFSTNYTTNVVQFFAHTFGNLFTNTYSTRGIVGTISAVLTNSPFAPAGFPPTTNFVVKLTPTTGAFGDFFILPTNACGALVLSNMLTTVTAITNLPTVTSNAPVTGTNVTITFTPGNVIFTTNHTLIFLPVTCPVDSVATRGGMGEIKFVRRDFDSLIGQFWDPVTNDYALPELDETNHVIVMRHFQRRVPRPDFLLSAVDLVTAAAFTYSNSVDGAVQTITFTLTGFANGLAYRTMQFDDAGRPPNLAGPGTIVGSTVLPTVLALNKINPLYLNASSTAGTNNFLFPNETTQTFTGGWGSFDGTTNAPVVYPNGTTLADLENLITGPASTTPSLPFANINQPYSARLTAAGGHAPYAWSLAPTSAGLPSGLNLSSDGTISGSADGPAAIYDFTVRITDSVGTFRDVQYTLTVF
jgi:hypothetical protein